MSDSKTRVLLTQRAHDVIEAHRNDGENRKETLDRILSEIELNTVQEAQNSLHEQIGKIHDAVQIYSSQSRSEIASLRQELRQSTEVLKAMMLALSANSSAEIAAAMQEMSAVHSKIVVRTKQDQEASKQPVKATSFDAAVIHTKTEIDEQDKGREK